MTIATTRTTTVKRRPRLSEADENLLTLWNKRRIALEGMGDNWHRGTPVEARRAAEVFRRIDAEITAELIRRRKPAVLGDITLHLTADRLNFITLDAATGQPIYISPSQGGWKSLLLDYADAIRKGRL